MVEAGKWKVFYDGDCGFCQTCVRWLRKKNPQAFECIPYQREDFQNQFPEIDWNERHYGVQVQDSDGRIAHREEAVAWCLLRIRGYEWLGEAMLFHVCRPVFAIGYRIIAKIRGSISRVFCNKKCYAQNHFNE